MNGGAPEQIFKQEPIENIFNIRVGIDQDPFNHCPLLIPIKSRRRTTGAKPAL